MKVSSALRTLPWVDESSVQTNSTSRQAKMTLKDPKLFNIQEIEKTLAAKGYYGNRLLAGPSKEPE